MKNKTLTRELWIGFLGILSLLIIYLLINFFKGISLFDDGQSVHIAADQEALAFLLTGQRNNTAAADALCLIAQLVQLLFNISSGLGQIQTQLGDLMQILSMLDQCILNGLSFIKQVHNFLVPFCFCCFHQLVSTISHILLDNKTNSAIFSIYSLKYLHYEIKTASDETVFKISF